ncbi:MAG: DNA repair ATPase [Myxococcota bacterium]|nr:DNA repair ATPase [Myxococcota bacterium]
MSEPENIDSAETNQDSAVEAGNYEVIKRRLTEQGQSLSTKVTSLNEQRKEAFGGTELTVIGNERIRTENNCIPRDIITVGGKLLFGYNVQIGLRTETKVNDVFCLHDCVQNEDGSWNLGAVDDASVGGFLSDERFVREFEELYKYYKDANLIQLRIVSGKLLAVFQVGTSMDDLKVFRWSIDVNGNATYIDNRGERDNVFPPSHDFEWKVLTRDDQVSGLHPHVNIEDTVFVETVGGDLTVKIENNTKSGLGIYNEPVEDKNQALDDAEFAYARLGRLILIKVKPYNELDYRYLVYNENTETVRRIDAIGQACVQLPEDHGIIFPGGYYLQSGELKIFSDETDDLIFKRSIMSPNGEDVLFVFYRHEEGSSVLLPYNLIRKEVSNPIPCHGYSIFDNGTMIVFRQAGDEATRIHPVQLWNTAFVSDEFAANEPTDGSLLGRIGNADLVRGISDAFSVCRLIQNAEPNRQVFEDLIKSSTRLNDNYYWIGEAELGNLNEELASIQKTAELIIDEFEKVQQFKKQAAAFLEETTNSHEELLKQIHPDDWTKIGDYLEVMSKLRRHRGHIITLKDVRYINLEDLGNLEEQAKEKFEEVSKGAVQFLLDDAALKPLTDELAAHLEHIEAATKVNEVNELSEKIEVTGEGLTVLSEVIGDLKVEDPAARTRIVENISEVFGQLNRVRASLEGKRKTLLRQEGVADFAAQFQLFGQNVSSAIALADTPEKCDEQLSRIMVQLEELESRFSEFDEFITELALKREEVFDGFSSKKQSLLEERQRRAQNITKAAERIVSGVKRRSQGFKEVDDLNAFFASDPMVMKLRELSEQLGELGDSVKADEILAKLKASKQDALRGLRDRTELYEEGASVIKFGRHKFSVNTQPLDLSIVPYEEGMAIHLTGTDFYEAIDDEDFNQTKEFWSQSLASESKEVYRSEYLAASILFDAEARKGGLSIDRLRSEATSESGLLELVKKYAADRYDEGYERGLHDSDAALILSQVLSLQANAGLLRFSPDVRAIACLCWAKDADEEQKKRMRRRVIGLGRIRAAFSSSRSENDMAMELSAWMTEFLAQHDFDFDAEKIELAGMYLLEELLKEPQEWTTSADAVALRDVLFEHLQLEGKRLDFEHDLQGMEGQLVDQYQLVRAWLQAFLENYPEQQDRFSGSILETTVLILTEHELVRDISSAITHSSVKGLLGNHPRVVDQALDLRLDEFYGRLKSFCFERVPRFLEYRKIRHEKVVSERERLRIEEYMPRVLTSFVRNKLINDVYLPIIGDNLAKQLGALGDSKRTDLMGLLLLISPPGYGKTTLMEYLANSLGMIFMKVNGPSLGHSVISLDPSEAPNATARQEVEKVNLALEMGNNVMLYLDDIQHTNPEFLQKFISLCDAQRRIEGVWNGKTSTYDLRGKKFCVVMAGNPYTETGEKFQIPDMLANRADTYNLGDILDGKEEAFALSYVENALTSNSVLAPLATRDQQDIYKLIRMAKGEEIPSSELSHGYSAAELSEIVSVFSKLLVCQDVLLKVNLQYIESASQSEEYRTEPPFKLQGSYRNMAKLAEKVVSAMNDDELEALIDDHYTGESQTLTSGAEQNLLKLAEMRGRLSEEQTARWEQIKKDYSRIKRMGGGSDDPVARLVGSLSGLDAHLDGIRDVLAMAVEKENGEQWSQLEPHLEKLGRALQAVAKPELQVQVTTETSDGLDELLQKHTDAIEKTLIPMVLHANKSMESTRNISQPVAELLELLKMRMLSSGNLDS